MRAKAHNKSFYKLKPLIKRSPISRSVVALENKKTKMRATNHLTISRGIRANELPMYYEHKRRLMKETFYSIDPIIARADSRSQ